MACAMDSGTSDSHGQSRRTYSCVSCRTIFFSACPKWRAPPPSSVHLPLFRLDYPDAALGHVVSAVGRLDLPGRFQCLADEDG